MFAGIMLVVVLSNWSTIRRKLGGAKGQVTEAQSDPEAEGGQIGSDLQGYLNDEDFFDDEEDTSDIMIETGKKVSVMLDSIGTTLRITIIDSMREPVSDADFVANVEGVGRYSDGNGDGVIEVENLEEGKYFVSVEPLDGYIVPTTKTMINISSDIEYKALSDVSYLIHDEEDVIAENEDLFENLAVKEADGTESTDIDAYASDGKVGIDVSSMNGDIDWDEVAESDAIDYAIIRCGYRGADTGSLILDSCFKSNMMGASKAGIPVGVYFASQAVDETEAIEEASMVIEACKIYMLDYPVFIYSTSTDGGRADRLTGEKRTEVLSAFCETIVNSGYEAGIYASAGWLDDDVDASKLNAYHMWLAQYIEKPDYDGYYDYWQYTSKGSVDGIETKVDLNINYSN